MKQRLSAAKALSGNIQLPGDKSISHRAVILNSIAYGSAKISNFAQSDDCKSTIACLQSLGVQIDINEDNTINIQGMAGRGLQGSEDVLDAGNSGTTMRLLTGLLSAQPFLSVITGDKSLRSRPMGRVIQPLKLMGAQISGHDGDSKAPLTIKGGSLKGIRYELPVASAQLKSALLLAGLFAQGDTVIIEPASSRDHTERMLKAMGADIKVDELTISLSPGSLNAVDMEVPGDISSAAFWLVAAAIHPQASLSLRNVGINPTRSGIIDVLQSMGANLTIKNEHEVSGEPVADLHIESSSLAGIEIGGDIIPRLIDEIPIIALAGSMARGKTVIKDAKELRVKESDRISTTAKELSKLGADIEELPDGMVINGGKALSAAECDSYGDHRIAMMLGIAALVSDGEMTIDKAEAADVSYSGFWQDLTRVSSI